MIPIRLSSRFITYLSAIAPPVPSSAESLDPPQLGELRSIHELRSCNGLKFLHLNIRSLLPKLDFINVLTTESNLDILVITELSGKVSDSDVAIMGFNLFRADRHSRGGGVIIYIKEHLAACVISSASVPKCCECIILDVSVGGDTHITISVIYRPPSAPNS